MKKIRVMGILIFIMSLLCIMTYIGLHTCGEDVFLGSREITTENKDWNLTYKGKRVGTIRIPLKWKGGKGETVSITKQISFINGEEQYLCFQSVQSKVWVYVDGELVYTYGVNGAYALGKSPGSAWNVVKLSGIKSQYTVEITLESPYSFYSGRIPSVYTGTKTALYTYILRRKIPYFLIGLIVILIAVFILGSYLILRNMKMECGLYLTLAVFHLGLWFLVDSQMTQFIFRVQYYFSQLQCLLILSFPVILTAYVLSLREYEGDVIMEGVFIASILSMIVEHCLVLARLFDYVQMLPVTIIIYAFILVGVVRKGVLRWRKKRSWESISWRDIGLVFMISTGIRDLVINCCFLELPKGRWFHFGVLFFILIIFVGYEREFAAMYLSQVQEEKFKLLAYTDALTGLSNRASFEEQMDALRNHTCNWEKVYLVIVDINDLKWINDSLGHKFGDKAIIQVAKTMESIFGKYGCCYRIGGDEFCILIHKISGIKVKYMLDKLNYDIAKTYFVDGYTLSVASGYEVYETAAQKSVEDIFVKADKNMYYCKQEMKSKRKNKVDIF